MVEYSKITIIFAMIILFACSQQKEFTQYEQLEEGPFLSITRNKPPWVVELEQIWSASISQIWLSDDHLALWQDIDDDDICDGVHMYRVTENWPDKTKQPTVWYWTTFPCERIDKLLEEQIYLHGFTGEQQ